MKYIERREEHVRAEKCSQTSRPESFHKSWQIMRNDENIRLIVARKESGDRLRTVATVAATGEIKPLSSNMELLSVTEGKEAHLVLVTENRLEIRA